MKFVETKIPDVFKIAAEPHVDERGMFARLYCPGEFCRAGINFNPSQINVSRNNAKHTLRGMHFQNAPFAESKVVRVVRGLAYDVVIDLRPESPAYLGWIGLELSAQSAEAVFIPEGCAHGFLTIEPDTDVLYQMGCMYQPGHARGFRWDDPIFGITWPADPMVIDTKDRSWPDYVKASAPNRPA